MLPVGQCSSNPFPCLTGISTTMSLCMLVVAPRCATSSLGLVTTTPGTLCTWWGNSEHMS